ncbi:MAG: hypothetical protein NUW01_18445 [Gemmatimonadaceae bacterium]|nr:hypothetical protein [Gemmatimonadaceae bacterium]
MSVTICGGVGKRYYVRMRLAGMRKFFGVGRPTRSYKAALRRMAEVFADSPNYDLGEVLMTAEYYDPVQVCEIRR